MARIVLTDVDVTLNGQAISEYVASVTINTPVDVVETTAFGPVGARTRTAGLKDHSVTLEFHNDFASGAIEDIVDGLIGTETTLVIKPTSGAISATNPAYLADGTGTGATKAGKVLISEWTPLNGAVGELSTVSVTWPISGQIVKDVTP